MTEDQAIERIEAVLTLAIGSSDAAVAAPVAWNEMKAIARESEVSDKWTHFLGAPEYPQYDIDKDNYIHRNGKRSYDKAGKHPV